MNVFKSFSCLDVEIIVGVGASTSNIDVGTGISIDNPFNNNVFDECIKNNEENSGYGTDFNFYSRSAKYLF